VYVYLGQSALFTRRQYGGRFLEEKPGNALTWEGCRLADQAVPIVTELVKRAQRLVWLLLRGCWPNGAPLPTVLTSVPTLAVPKTSRQHLLIDTSQPMLWASAQAGFPQDSLQHARDQRWNVAQVHKGKWDYLVRHPFVPHTLLLTEGTMDTLEVVWDCYQFLEVDYHDAEYACFERHAERSPLYHTSAEQIVRR
jgi:hypothetical protein